MLKQISLILMLWSSSLTIANANTAVSLTTGQSAPFSGVLMDGEKSDEIHTQLLERDLYKELSASYSNVIDIQKKNLILQETKVNELVEQNTKLSTQVQTDGTMGDFEKILIFSLGIVATIGGGLALRAIK